ncbi:MAG: T9SS type A sorting domain-containing protein [Chitinophagaceae bacterium]
MKKTYLLLLLLVFGLMAHAQKIRFTDTSNQWTVYRFSYDDQKGVIGTGGALTDTLIAGLRYRNFGNVGIAEDTISGKLSFRFLTKNYSFGAVTDTLEHLFFDYNFKVNDTLHVDFGDYHFCHFVKRIDTVLLGNNSVRVWSMRPKMGNVGPTGSSQDDYQFVEGVGTLDGSLFSIFPSNSAFEMCSQLRCFRNRGIYPSCVPALQLPCSISSTMIAKGVLAASEFDNLKSCEVQTVGVATINKQIPIIIKPNPGGAEMIMLLRQGLTKGSLKIYDIRGSLVKEIGVLTSSIPIGQYLNIPGIYFYSLQGAANRYSGKFIYR